jgi:transposase
MYLALVSDDLWDAIEPLLPKEPPKPKGGRPRVPDRATFTGIVFILRTGTPWRLLPREFGCGSGTTCWRRLRDWQAAGVWERLHSSSQASEAGTSSSRSATPRAVSRSIGPAWSACVA